MSDTKTLSKMPAIISEVGDVSNENYKPYDIEQLLPDYGKHWYKVPHLLRLSIMIVIVSLSATCSGYDLPLLNSLYSMPSFLDAIGNPDGAVLGAITNGSIFGFLLGSFCSPALADSIGRIKTIFAGNIIIICGIIIQSCAGVWLHGSLSAPNPSRSVYAMILVARIVIGVGVSLTTVASVPLISELSYPAHRQTCTTFYYSSFYLGAIVAAWTSFGTRNYTNNWNWRIPTILQCLFPIIQLSTILFVPESPRFLISTGKHEEARAFFLKYHAGNDEKIGGDLVDFEMTEVTLAIEQEKMYSKSTSYFDFLRTSANRKRLRILCCMGVFVQLSGNGLVSFYISKVLISIGITSVEEQLIVNGGLMIYNWGVCTILALFVVPRLKRKVVITLSLALMLIFFVIWTVLSAINQERNFEQKSLGQGVLAMIFLFYLAYNLGLNGTPYLYISEILPYSLRAKGLGLFVAVQNLAVIYNGFVNPIAMDAIEWKYYIVYCCILVVELTIVVFTFVETSGRTLEEIGDIFGDGIGSNGNQTVVEQLSLQDGKIHE